jgi:hypothetical protein
VAALFDNGRIIDLILLFILAECVLLGLWRRDGLRLADLLPNILSGAALMLAVRFALVESRWEWVALSLLGALLAHLCDLVLRMRRCPA